MATSRPRDDSYLRTLTTLDAKRNALAADVDQLPDQPVGGAAKAATAAWIETATERELNLWTKFSDQAFIDAVKAKGPTTAYNSREAKIRQGAADHPWLYSPTIARACGPVFVEPAAQTGGLIITGLTLALITRRAVWLRRFSQYEGTDRLELQRFRTRLGLTDSTTPSDVRINLRYWTNASTYGLAGYSVWLFTAITTSPKIQKASQKLKVFWHGQGSK
ncbi:hypothetical protein PROFUN_17035 [Planoprotostelium fungivorum]|uniref:Uncharacterized protein n=1 Tax=Planoprotostelium fungivorum TaxID=1890364 RepID=A0A2P6MMV9_9EUKA|nr:hypothetical protein PROFUN_17035 [Planoprotostelium fungivorum]